MTHKEIKTIFENVLYQHPMAEIEIIISYLDTNIIETFNKIIKLNKTHDIIECKDNILIISGDNVVYIEKTEIIKNIFIGYNRQFCTITNSETHCVDDYLIYDTYNAKWGLSAINQDVKYKNRLECKYYARVYFYGNYLFACTLDRFQIINIKTNEIYYNRDRLCFDKIVINFETDALLLCVYKNILFFSADAYLYICEFNDKHELILKGILQINPIHDVCAYDNEFYILSSYEPNAYINVYNLESFKRKRIIDLPKTVMVRYRIKQMCVNAEYMHIIFKGGVLILNRTKSNTHQRDIIIHSD